VVAGYKDISQDINLVEKLKADSDELSASIDKLFLDKDITNFIETHDKIKKLKAALSNFEYLANLSEETLYRNFMSHWTTNLDMSDLSQDDKLTIINLKLRYLTSLQHTP